MTRVWLLSAFHLVTFSGPDGQSIEINPAAIVSVRPARGHDHHASEVNCLIHTTDGKFVAVREDCGEVNKRLTE